MHHSQSSISRLPALALALAAHLVQAAEPALQVAAPPDSFFEWVRESDREAARSFYKKHLDIDGLPVVAAAIVDDRALIRTHEIVTHMLAGRPDVLRAMAENRMYLIIIGRDQVYTDMPEYRRHPNPEFQNERVRGTGGRPTSFGEENLLSLPLDRYDDESIGVHEFAHTIDGTLRSLDSDWNRRKRAVFENARRLGLYRDAYAGSNAGEYWAEIVQCYFDCNRVNNWNHGPVGTREQLRRYDPEGYELVRSAFNLGPGQDWRYAWLQPLPNVAPPPAKLGFPAYYTKFTWAREFPVLGRQAGDQALLKANDTIRKMFAYRHDILKALIADGARLVVLGRGESLRDLPEFNAIAAVPEIDPLTRALPYHPQIKLLAVGEENVLADPAAPFAGDHRVVSLLADAFYSLTSQRPVDPNWEKRGREVQQYELRVARLDRTFGERIRTIFGETRVAERWSGTAAVHGESAYWTAGVLAYFDAAGQDAAPPDAPHPIRTREALRQYDPALFEVVNATMAYEGKVDWRFRPASR